MSKSTVEGSTKTKENDAAQDSAAKKTECGARHVLQRDRRDLGALVLRVEAAWCGYLWSIIDSSKGYSVLLRGPIDSVRLLSSVCSPLGNLSPVCHPSL